MDEFEDRRLIEAWRSAAERARPRPDCPPADQVWRAARGEAPLQERLATIDHLSECPVCAEAWRLARAIEVPGETLKVARPQPFAWRAIALPAVAAALVVLASLSLLRLEPPPIERYPGTRRIETTTPDGAVLPRDAFVLRWKPGPAGSRYRVIVTAETLTDVVDDKPGLEATEYRVPAERLASRAAGTRLRWRVLARAPGGTGIESGTLTVVVR